MSFNYDSEDEHSNEDEHIYIKISGFTLHFDKEILMTIPYFRSYLERWSNNKKYIDLSDRDALGLLNVINYVRTGAPLDSRYNEDALYYGVDIEGKDTIINLPRPLYEELLPYYVEMGDWKLICPYKTECNSYLFSLRDAHYCITSNYNLIIHIDSLGNNQRYVNKLAFAIIDKIEVITYGTPYVIDGIYLDILYNIDKRGDEPFHYEDDKERLRRSRITDTLCVSIPILGLYKNCILSDASTLKVTLKDDVSLIENSNTQHIKIVRACFLKYVLGPQLLTLIRDNLDNAEVRDTHHISVKCDRDNDKSINYTRDIIIDLLIEGNVYGIYIVYVPFDDISNKRYFDYGMSSYSSDIITNIQIMSNGAIVLSYPSYILRICSNSRIYYLHYHTTKSDLSLKISIYNIPGTIHTYIGSSNIRNRFGIRTQINRITYL